MPEMNARKPVDLREAQPFHRNADAYHKAGWLPFPIPARSKGKPPTGATGDVDPSHKRWLKKIEGWLKKAPKAASIAVRVPPGVLCIDVDAYKEGVIETMAEIAEEVGEELPETWMQSPRSDGHSGHYLYRVPEELKWPGKLCDGVETVHSTHRYLVSAPSIHEKQGKDPDVEKYLWYAPGEPIDGNGDVAPPRITDLPELPEAWVEYLTQGRAAKHLREKQFTSVKERDTAITAWITSKGAVMCNMMAGLVEEGEEEMGAGAHDTARDLVYRLAALAAEGHRGLFPALDLLLAAFAGEVERDDRGGGTSRSYGEAEKEWLRFRDGAIKKVMALEEDALFEGYPEECRCAEVDADGRPKRVVDLGSFDPYAEIARTYQSLAPGDDGYGTYLVNGELTEVTEKRMTRVSVDYLRMLVLAKVAWTKMVGADGGKIPVPATPPKEFLMSLLADERRYEYLPVLKGRTSTPFYALDEKGAPELVAKNGYHAGSAMFLDMEPDLAESVAGLHKGTYMKRAVSLIDELLEGFPFVGPADRATAYAALVLPFVRDLIEGPTPLHLFEAPMARTGKSLLVDVISTVTLGGTSAEHGYQKFLGPSGREANVELGKRVVSALVSSPGIVTMDNINFKVDCPELAGAMTTYPEYAARMMATHSTANLSTRCMWMMTANNVSASDEMLPRVIPCRLDARQKNPERERPRPFAHPDLLEWARGRRPALVWAVMTLVQNWIEDARPEGEFKLGGFEHWVRVVGGIMAAAGFDEFMTNRDSFAERASDAEDGLEALVAEWAELGVGYEKTFKASELAITAAATDLIPEDRGDRATKLGRILSRATDNPVGDYFIRRRTLHGTAGYYLESADGSTPPLRRRKRRMKGMAG